MAKEKKHNHTSVGQAEPNGPGVPVIGVVASAGYIESLEQLLSHAEILADAAIVVVLQQREALVDDVLARLAEKSARPLLVADDLLQPEPDSIYLAPDGMKLTMADGKFRVTAAKEPPGKGEPSTAFWPPWRKMRGSGRWPWCCGAWAATARWASPP